MKQVFATLDGLAARWIASDVAVLVLRAGLALMFVESAADKALNFGLYAEEVAGMGVPFAEAAILAAILVEALGSIALLTGLAATPALVLLAGYTLVVSFVYFDFWNLGGKDAVMARKAFLKNIAVASGILFALAWRHRGRKG